jgi:hypothetical protein
MPLDQEHLCRSVIGVLLFSLFLALLCCFHDELRYRGLARGLRMCGQPPTP